MEEWRTILYPLGFLSSFAFGARFIVQWLQSERQQRSLVPRSFWYLSLLGNVLLALHSFIQVQYHICVVQACNIVIAWRNLNLMQAKSKQVSFSFVLGLLIAAIALISAAFIVQDFYLLREGHWFRIPTAPWQDQPLTAVSWMWHALGTLAYLLFSSRFWVQWWLAEQAHKSELFVSFWWLSLTGALLSIAYFLHIRDSVNLIGPLIGIVPYIRNLMLIQKQSIPVKNNE
ncbi:lipid-A-disaccharide synthase N-terminal domain-containing protein [Candidatus Protochlamydia phocaeensis]|uniref:lipid-A-disaccharide synthase N-terminal domain-containing protein n=1 Tax=Candidatus Protochlamydia phocaeensis TaxID=1414722 RepID=UPI00083848E4|nr:lipid-A-disaccharide synthase N-terminal domain-containing protein [Candidatus Protochlamydia phocaeensis]